MEYLKIDLHVNARSACYLLTREKLFYRENIATQGMFHENFANGADLITRIGDVPSQILADMIFQSLLTMIHALIAMTVTCKKFPADSTTVVPAHI